MEYKMHPESPAFNAIGIFEVLGNFQSKRWDKSITLIIKYLESQRTFFIEDEEGKPR